MKKQILEEIKDMKYLLNYDRGRILSEQPVIEDEIEIDDFELEEEDDLDYTLDLDEEMGFSAPTMNPGTKEKERTITTPGTKPNTRPSTPYRPKPGPKKAPKAEKKELPNWLSFDELGIEFE